MERNRRTCVSANQRSPFLSSVNICNLICRYGRSRAILSGRLFLSVDARRLQTNVVKIAEFRDDAWIKIWTYKLLNTNTQGMVFFAQCFEGLKCNPVSIPVSFHLWNRLKLTEKPWGGQTTSTDCVCLSVDNTNTAQQIWLQTVPCIIRNNLCRLNGCHRCSGFTKRNKCNLHIAVMERDVCCDYDNNVIAAVLKTECAAYIDSIFGHHGRVLLLSNALAIHWNSARDLNILKNVQLTRFWDTSTFDTDRHYQASLIMCFSFRKLDDFVFCMATIASSFV